ncbi:amidase [Actinocrispum wychmicini]|uniref:Aspartyl-tRNA(Asn)/glutamyl-tRNA(Gln) amidotransferase subunit A n=1 Tax=Actinocrispum wychmicini TaxID=1213861 RepID=A0A4R2JG56_9PSEU|nr:amidase [Actinocrispum wychmicini]TCO55848.1 aspartyl-tRNA(Asn)/glutamyl-tRNA(Gln) amidotransferase subunit A [Actinocrispum wychmicini]
MTDVSQWTAERLGAAYATGELSPVEATRAALRAVETYDDLCAFAYVDHEGALKQAAASEQRWVEGRALGPFDGVPASIKDLFLTRGMPTLRGSRHTDPKQPWDIDSPAAAALRANGLVLLGKTTTAELGWKGTTDNPVDGVTRNPWDRTLTAGGSSGGSGVAVRAGMGAVSVATDAAGSARIPASFCGIVGFKPTHGRIPMYPPSVLGTLAHAGPMARSVGDVAVLTDILAAPDHRDPSWTPTVGGAVDLAGVRVAFSPTLGYVEVDPEIAAIVAATVTDLGLRVEEANPGFPDPSATFDVLWSVCVAHIVRRSGAADDPGLQALAERGARHSVAEYLDAQSELAALAVAMGEFHTRFDVLITPTVPIEPFAVGHDVPPESGLTDWPQWTPFAYPFNMSRQPALSVPIGRTARGLPVGIQIVGPRYADHLVLAVGALVEQLRPAIRYPQESA